MSASSPTVAEAGINRIVDKAPVVVAFLTVRIGRYVGRPLIEEWVAVRDGAEHTKFGRDRAATAARLLTFCHNLSLIGA
jgi:hypothetical protein